MLLFPLLIALLIEHLLFIMVGINWKTSLIGGSYALHQFHQNFLEQCNNWEPDDIDIMIGSDTEEDFEKETASFQAKVPQAQLIKFTQKKWGSFVDVTDVQTGQTERKTMLDCGQENEVFHDLVYGSRSYIHPEIGKIQLVHIKIPPNRSLLSVLAETTDIPCCVSYSVESYFQVQDKFIDQSNPDNAHHKVHTKIWHFPEKGREILLSGRGPASQVCLSRKQKYIERGYIFYEDPANGPF